MPHKPMVNDIQRKNPNESRNLDFLEGKIRIIVRKETTYEEKLLLNMLAEAELEYKCEYIQDQCCALVGGIKSYVYSVAIVKTLCTSTAEAYNLKIQ